LEAITGIIALVPDRWAGIVMPRHQVLRRLARDYPVVWIEPAHNWREHLVPGGRSFLAADRWHSPEPGLDVLTPGSRHPGFHRPRWLRLAALRSRLAVARRRLIERGARRVVLYLWRDEFAAAIDLVSHDVCCYHVDDEYNFSEVDVPNSSRESALLRRVDQVIVHSRALMQKKGALNPHTALIPNGVEFEAFSQSWPEPADLDCIPRPRIGYAGVIKKQLDLALLARLARARPQHQFVLVGPVMNVAGKEAELAALRALPNVHWLGSKPADMLPAYIQHFDLCLMCYEVNDYTNYIYPLKLNEYLATGIPTVCSCIHAIADVPDVVIVARSDADWLAAIDACRDEDSKHPCAVASRQAFARRHDWDHLVAAVSDVLRRALSRAERDGSRSSG
jgi:glycosyltransferase involved in cell wall biosynthesis